MNYFAVSPANRKFIFGIVVAAAILRVGTVALFNPPLISDDKDYDAIARSLAHGDGFRLDGYPTAYRLPAYPLLLAASYAVFGDSKTPIRMLQAIADVISCLLLFSIGKKMFSEKVGLLAAAILALFPIQVLYISHLMTETIFTTILLLIVWVVVVKENESHVLAESVILGVLTGLGMMLRTTMALIPLVIFLCRWKSGTPVKPNVRSLAILAAAAFIMVSPWLVRNYAVFHRVSFTSNAGVNFWMGNHAGASGAYSFPKENNPLAAVADDFDRSDLGFKLGFEFIRTHPLESAVTEVKKIAHFFAADYWLLVTMEYRPEWASAKNASAVFARLSIVDILVLHLPYAAVLLLGTFGLICPARKDEEKFFFLCALLVYWLAVHLVFYADARYRFPIVPIVILAAAYGWFILRENTFQRTKIRLLAFTLLCIIFVGGWLGEIFTLRSKAVAHQPVAERLLSKSEQGFGSQSTDIERFPPKTR
jgi:4-amino-4-deoxy-L-arabinose transferase-like glycosyltransferase